MIHSITIRFESGLFVDIISNGDAMFDRDAPVGICENSIVSEFQGIVEDLNTDDSDEDEPDILNDEELDADGNYDDTGI